MSKLPPDKAKRLADKVSEDTRRHWDDQVKELTRHDLLEKEARKIVTDGILDAAKKWHGVVVDNAGEWEEPFADSPRVETAESPNGTHQHAFSPGSFRCACGVTLSEAYAALLESMGDGVVLIDHYHGHLCDKIVSFPGDDHGYVGDVFFPKVTQGGGT